MNGFTEFEFAQRKVYRRGSGPGVLIMSEMPGITPQVVTFANRAAEQGYTVWMPHLFGEDGREKTSGYLLASLTQVCVRAEFAALAANRPRPIADTLRSMCRALHAEAGGKGVGAVGMCFTGNFGLALMLEPAVLAPVLSQPSTPFPFTAARRASLDLCPDDLAICKRRAAQGVGILALRFTGDPVVPAARFETLRREFGSACETIEIDSSPGNPFGISPKAHSVLTADLVDQAGHPTRAALDRVFHFFSERLQS